MDILGDPCFFTTKQPYLSSLLLLAFQGKGETEYLELIGIKASLRSGHKESWEPNPLGNPDIP